MSEEQNLNMTTPHKPCRIVLLLCLLLWGTGSLFAQSKYEMRAVWLTTVYGLDWPKVKATDELSRLRQQKELCDILDKLQEANFNTVFLQARLRGDVIYRSVIEPRSSVFTGKVDGNPGYDPLAFAIAECHKRGMECHAWFVTFPLGSDQSVKAQGKRSPVKRQPKLCKRYNGAWYLDPGLPGTSDYLVSLVRELVANYDIDGIHFDYIRYPEQADKFPDKSVYKRYGKGYKTSEWRRENINKLVYRIYDCVKQLKPWVQVSSSPLGKYSRIERVPNAGWTAYESVYQDPKMWLLKGKHDMVVPMMYYLHDNFFPFVDNWVDNCNGRMVVPGLGAYRMEKEEGDWAVTDITDQIDYSRYFGGAGCAFFRCANVLNNTKGLYDELKERYYRHPAMLPPLTWLNDSIPPAPLEIKAERQGTELKLSWTPAVSSDTTSTYTVYYASRDSIDLSAPHHILATGIRGTALYLPVDTTHEQLYFFRVTASSRYRIESPPSPSVLYYLSPYVK